jgi:hypothetical protein
MPEDTNETLNRRAMLAMTAAAITGGVAACARGTDGNSAATHTEAFIRERATASMTLMSPSPVERSLYRRRRFVRPSSCCGSVFRLGFSTRNRRWPSIKRVSRCQKK